MVFEYDISSRLDALLENSRSSPAARERLKSYLEEMPPAVLVEDEVCAVFSEGLACSKVRRRLNLTF